MTFPYEHQLLLCCIQPELPGDRISRLLQLPLNWDEIEEAALWHRLSPLLCHSLKALGSEAAAVPEDVMKRLEDVHLATLARNMYLRSELGRIGDAFQKRSLEVIVLKGLSLAEVVYESIALRPIGDIDLLVRSADLDHARTLLGESGYHSHGDVPSERLSENKLSDTKYHLSFSHPEKKILLELHWHIGRSSHPRRIALPGEEFLDALWKRARPQQLGEAAVLVLSPPDTLLHLCLHFVKHRFGAGGSDSFTSRFALIQLSDILRCLKHSKEKFDLKRLSEETGSTSAEEAVAVTFQILLRLAKDSGAKLDSPSSFYCGLVPDLKGASPGLSELIYARLFVRQPSLPIVPLGVFHFVRATLKAIFPPPHQIARQYGVTESSMRLYFYYLLRPFLVLRYWKQFMAELRQIRENVLLNRWMRVKK